MSRQHRRRITLPRQSTIFLASLALVAVVGVSLVMVDTPAAFSPVTQVEDVADAGPPTLPSASHPAALFIGDDYTQGTNTPDMSYGCMTATELGWECNIAAQPAVGYISGGPGQRLPTSEYGVASKSFVEQLPRLRELYRADMVVLDGGRNDLQFEIDDLDRAFAYTVSQVKAAWPNSHIVVIAPWLITQPVIQPPALAGRTIGDEFQSVLRSSPDFDGVDIIDPAALGWLSGVDASQYLSSDGYHPSPEGDQLIAHLLTEALRAERITDPS